MKFKNKLLIIPDIHTKYEKVMRIIEKFNKTHKFIFIGDYFDQFKDTPELNSATANWLKKAMNEYPDWVYLYGNHDVQYHLNVNCNCSGFSIKKKEAINSELTIDDWNKLKFFHYENGYWFSHAGITVDWFKDPMSDNITIDSVQNKIDESFTKLQIGETNNAIWASSYRRGGNYNAGGIVWEDFRDLKFIPNMHQVVGHTPYRNIITISDNIINASNTNVDNSGDSVYFHELLEIDENGLKNKLNTSYI